MTGQLAQAAQRWSQLPHVAEALSEARGSIDELLWRRDIRSAAASVTAASKMRGSRESAAMEGADIATAEDSPMGRVLAAAQAVTGEVPAVVDVWRSAPLQALARLHSLVGYGHLPSDELGRPRVVDETPDDPLNLGPAPEAIAASGRLALLAELVAESPQVPALVIAGIAHAELVGVRPFVWGSGLVGRAVVRVVLASRGVDPSLFSIPEAGMMQLGRPAYVRALRSYLDGSVDEYLIWFGRAVTLGAQSASAGVPRQP